MPQLEKIEIGAFAFSVISLPEFRVYEREWGDNKHVNKADTCLKLRNPVMDTSHKDLLERLRDCPAVTKVGVRKGGTREWIRCKREELTPEIINEMARCAREDPLKRNYFEASIGKYTNFSDWATLEFGVKDEMIIGYKLTIPSSAVPLFSLSPNIIYCSHAIWVPHD